MQTTINIQTGVGVSFPDMQVLATTAARTPPTLWSNVCMKFCVNVRYYISQMYGFPQK